MRHDRRSRHGQTHSGVCRGDLLFLLRRVPREIPRRAAALCRGEARRAAANPAGREDLHLPDASGNPPGRGGRLSDLRHGAGTGGAERRGRAERRTSRHDASLLDRPRPRRAGRRARHGRTSGGQALAGPADVQLGAIGAGDAGRAVGGLAVPRARARLDPQSKPQHVHADRDGDGHRLDLQRRRDPRPGRFPVGVPRPRRRRAGLFRSRGGHHRSRPARPGLGTQSPRADGRGDPRAARSRAQDRAQDIRRRRRT